MCNTRKPVKKRQEKYSYLKPSGLKERSKKSQKEENGKSKI